MIEVNCAALPRELLESNYSVMNQVHLRGHPDGTGACWSRPMAAHCSWMKSVKCHWTCKPTA